MIFKRNSSAFRCFTRVIFVAQLLLIHQTSFADENTYKKPIINPTEKMQKSGSVYVFGDESLGLLIPVKIVGAVSQPGIHYVPQRTDLTTLLAVAGGPTDKADTSEVTIKRQTKQGKKSVFLIDLKEILQDTEREELMIEANDTVFVPRQEPFISENALRLASMITAFATVFSAVIVGVTQLD